MFKQRTIVAVIICIFVSSGVIAEDNFFRVFTTRNGTENQIFEVDKNNFSPRLGFSWQPNFQGNSQNKFVGSADATVIRGGYAIAYDQFFLNAIQQAVPLVIDTINVNQNGNYSLTSSKVINQIRPTDPFLLAGDPGRLPTDRARSYLMFNRNQDVAIQTFGPTKNPFGGARILFNNPPDTRPTGGCMTQNYFGVLDFSDTAGTLLVLDDHNDGRPIPATNPTVFRFPGPDIPISMNCMQAEQEFRAAFQLFQQKNNSLRVRVASRQFQVENNQFRPVGTQRFYTPFTPTNQLDAFKFRFNSVDFVDRNENGRPDAIVYAKPTAAGAALFARGINETTLAANTPPKQLTSPLSYFLVERCRALDPIQPQSKR
jgi:hypothetical protein